eukprot:2324280-Prymnesium_polylepis.1
MAGAHHEASSDETHASASRGHRTNLAWGTWSSTKRKLGARGSAAHALTSAESSFANAPPRLSSVVYAR